METKARRITGFLAGLVLVAPMAALAGTTSMQLARGTWPLVSISIDGAGPFTFLLDTGTTRTLLDDGLAQSMGKQALGETTVRTPSGVSRAKLVRVDRLRVADREGRVIALVADIGRVRALPKDVVGILGLDVLSRYNFHIDYENRTLDLHDRGTARPIEGGVEIPAQLENGRLLLDVASRERSVWLALDTGAHRIVVYGDGRELVERDRYRHRKLASAGATGIVTEARVKRITVGSLELRDLPATILSHAVTTIEEGLLPGHLFQSLYVDTDEGLVVVNGRSPER